MYINNNYVLLLLILTNTYYILRFITLLNIYQMCKNKHNNNNKYNKCLLMFTQDLTAPVTDFFTNISYKIPESFLSFKTL